MTPKRRHHSGSVRAQRLTLKSNKRATDLFLYDTDCYVWHKNQHNSFFVEKVMIECLQVMADHRVRSGWNLSDTGGDCITGSLLPADTLGVRGLIQINMLYVTNLPEADSNPTHVWHIAVHLPSHSGICAHTAFQVIALFLSQPSSLFCSVRWFFYFCGVVILQHRLLAIVRGSLQRPACSLMSAWLTSSLAQISIKAPSNTRLLQMAAVCSVALFVWVALSSTC